MAVSMSHRPGTQARRFGVAILVLVLVPLRLAARERADAAAAVPGTEPGGSADAGTFGGASEPADAGVVPPGSSGLDAGSAIAATADAGTPTSQQRPPPKRPLPEYDGREPPT